MAEPKKYYWLKLKKDFFKRHDIQIVESMPNGKDYILFYLKMLVESVDHNGYLKFNDTIPYNESMLSTITNTNVDVVRSAMKVFTELKMIEVLEDNTIYMLEVEKMLGSETYWAEQKRLKRIESKNSGKCPEIVQDVQQMSNQEKEIEIEIDKEIDIDKERESTEKKNSLSESFEFCKYYEQLTGRCISPQIQRVQELIELYTFEWLSDATDKAVSKSKYTLDYIQGILKNWTTEGKEATSGGTNQPNTSEGKGKWAGFKPKESIHEIDPNGEQPM